MAAKTSARPFYLEFLARVIQIEAVQCYRMAVTDDHTSEFFADGRRPGVFGDFHWSLDVPEAFPWGPLAPAPDVLASYATRLGRGSRGLRRVHR